MSKGTEWSVRVMVTERGQEAALAFSDFRFFSDLGPSDITDEDRKALRVIAEQAKFRIQVILEKRHQPVKGTLFTADGLRT